MINALRIQIRVIAAIVYRLLLSEHGTTRIGYLSALLKPVGQIIMFATIFSFLSRNLPVGNNYVIFIATGIIPYNLCMSLSNKIMSTHKSGKAIINHPLITPFSLTIAVLVIESAILIVTSIVILLGVGILGLWDYKIDSLLTALLTVMAAITLGYGVGLINLSITIKIPAYEKVWQILSMPLFILSGIFFTSERMPPEAVEYLKYNPVLQIVESMRSAMYRTWESQIFSASYLVSSIIVTIFIGLFLQRITAKQITK